jgi:hypothetical protein
VLDALSESLDWHLEQLPADSETVLNACRAWRWARTGRWTSKRSPGQWARGRLSEPAVVDAALADRSARLDAGAVATLAAAARAALAAASR